MEEIEGNLTSKVLTQRVVKTRSALGVLKVGSVAVGVLLICISAGCSSPEVANWRRGDGRCRLHDQEMYTVTVNNLAGPAPQFPPEYHDAKEQEFPNCGIEYPSSMFGDERGEIFVCETCDANRQVWLEKRKKAISN